MIDKMKFTKLKVAMIGAGEHARRSHAPALHYLCQKRPNEIEMTAVCDPDTARADQFMSQFGFKSVFNSIESMLSESKPDCCLCIIPAKYLVNTVSVLLRNNIPTLLEKPLGDSIEESLVLEAIAKETGVKNMVSANRRFVPVLKYARDWCSQMGDIQFVRTLFARPNRDEPNFLWSTAVHSVDTTRFLAGDISAYDITPLFRRDNTRWVHLSGVSADNIKVNIDIMPTCGMNMERYELYGDGFHCHIQIEDFFKRVSCVCWSQNKISNERSMDEKDLYFVKDGGLDELTSFIDAIQKDLEPEPSIHDFLPSAKICHDFMMRD